VNELEGTNFHRDACLDPLIAEGKTFLSVCCKLWSRSIIFWCVDIPISWTILAKHARDSIFLSYVYMKLCKVGWRENRKIFLMMEAATVSETSEKTSLHYYKHPWSVPSIRSQPSCRRKSKFAASLFWYIKRANYSIRNAIKHCLWTTAYALELCLVYNPIILFQHIPSASPLKILVRVPFTL
jgi:hypothetical protein